MEHPAGEADDGSLRVDFDRRLRLEFRGSRITSDAGLLAYRELDNALGLTDVAGAALSECRRGRNTRHLLTGLLRQSVFGRLAGYEDVNDADRLAHDPAMRAVVDRRGLDRAAASTSQMGRFETAWLTGDANLVLTQRCENRITPSERLQAGLFQHNRWGADMFRPTLALDLIRVTTVPRSRRRGRDRRRDGP